MIFSFSIISPYLNKSNKKIKPPYKKVTRWSWKRDSNTRPAHYECAALPTELFQQMVNIIILKSTPIINSFEKIFHHEKSSANIFLQSCHFYICLMSLPQKYAAVQLPIILEATRCVYLSAIPFISRFVLIIVGSDESVLVLMIL